MTLQRTNTFPYTFKATEQGDITGTSDSIDSIGNGGDKVVTGFDTTNAIVGVSTGGLTVELGKRGYWYYDFATDGGAVGTVTLRGPKLPTGAVITKAYSYYTTAATSGGSATVAYGVESDDATGIEGATAIGTAATAGAHDTDADGTAANFTTITTAERDLILTIGTAALTAGAFVLVCDYDILKADTSS